VYIKTVASRWFMRGTDPIKSTWVYPKLKNVKVMLYIVTYFLFLFIY